MAQTFMLKQGTRKNSQFRLLLARKLYHAHCVRFPALFIAPAPPAAAIHDGYTPCHP